MKLVLLFILLNSVYAYADINETVFVESTTDTDSDGVLDLIAVTIDRPSSSEKLPVILKMSPYSQGGNSLDFHDTDVDLLPQDQAIEASAKRRSFRSKSNIFKNKETDKFSGYANVYADSVGTGKSTGCPTVGDMSETLGAKAVIDWLNGRARAFNSNGKEVKATWSNGNVGMIGVSYNGTLPIMVATTGVEGLKAIIPIAAISNWYDYYRANGLVVNPGGYIGEDADILGQYIVRKNACKKELSIITQTMGREHGDFSAFWQKRDYLKKAKDIKAAVFLAQGQADWNVKQKQAIQLFEALDEQTPKRLFLHLGAHSYPIDRGFRNNVDLWFDHYVKGVDNGINKKLPVRIQAIGETVAKEQSQWPHESTFKQVFTLGNGEVKKIIDIGSQNKLETFVKNPTNENPNRLVYMSKPLENDTLFSGTANVQLTLSLINRRAANITIALVQFKGNSVGKIITRGWADPQNHLDFNEGELLNPGQKIQLKFKLEPKQFIMKKGYQLGVLIASTDYSYTLRPSIGTEIEIFTGEDSFVEFEADSKIQF